MNISFLREFIVSVPAHCETDSLMGAWHDFQRFQTEQMVIVNSQRQPMGILRLSRFVAQLDLAQLNLEPSLSTVLHQLDPIAIYSVDTPVSQLSSQIPQLGEQAIGLVNASGQYVGLLDHLGLLRHWAKQGGSPMGRSSASRKRSQPADQPAKPLDSLIPDPLIDILERLPLSLMLQTSAGRVITQNQAWRQQVGAIQHPQRIRRAAARVLEAPLACETSDRTQTFTPSMVADLPFAQSTTHPSRSKSMPQQLANLCHYGPEPNTCVCVSQMKNGQDRVWQFFKIPMGFLPSRCHHWQEGLHQDGLMPFKLASLKFNPDPNWRSLIQTETLWLVLAQDITEQQQVAKELAARNADLIQLNRLKDEFLACISHELKTPLTAVLGMSSLLKDQMLGELNDRQLHYAQLIYRSGRHLIAIINSILDLTRAETGQLDLTVESVHLPTVCQQAYEQAQQQQIVESSSDTASVVRDSERQFHLEIQPGLQQILADELRLRQMLSNLLSNAIKFSRPQDEIGLRVESWEGWIAFTVWDQGVGIPADKQHRIFQKFQQVEHPLTRQFRGTGLGLVLTQQLAHLHGGDVSFTSIPGQGSQFTLLLPPAPPQALKPSDPQRLPTTAATEPRNRLVLLIEAQAEALAARLEQLDEIGYRAVIARSGTEGIEKARRLQPAAILLNPRLPLLSGWDVLTLLKSDPATQEIPIIVTSVRVERNQAYQNGAERFLSLPVDTGLLQHCLAQLVHPLEPDLPDTLVDLTVLHLYEGTPSFTLIADQSAVTQGLNRLLYPYHCRVLEVDDLEQADLLARVWKPDVVLIDRLETDPGIFMQQLSQTSYLAGLPLITFSTVLTEAANQIPGLAVFPYLAHPDLTQPAAFADAAASGQQPDVTQLVQVIQLAAGIHWIPQILIVDAASLAPNPMADTVRPPVQALMQYLQTAGFRSTASQDWSQLQQKLQRFGIDLLLLCVSGQESQAQIERMVQMLQQLPHRPIVLVWSYQLPLHAGSESGQMPSSPQEQAATTSQSEIVPFAVLGLDDPLRGWQPIATRIMPPDTPILELLSQINQLLHDRS